MKNETSKSGIEQSEKKETPKNQTISVESKTLSKLDYYPYDDDLNIATDDDILLGENNIEYSG